MDRTPLLPGSPTGQSKLRSWERERQEAGERAQGSEVQERAGHARRAASGTLGTSSLSGQASHSDLWASHCTLKKSVTDSASPSLPNPRQSGTASPSTETETSHTEGETEAEGGIGVQASRSCKLGSQSQDAPWVLPGPAPSPGAYPP